MCRVCTKMRLLVAALDTLRVMNWVFSRMELVLTALDKRVDTCTAA